MDREEILRSFHLESQERLVQAEDAAIALEVRPDDDELLKALSCAVHGVKGDAAAVGYDDAAEIAHVLEDLLDDLRDRRAHAGSDVISCVLGTIDVLREGLRDGFSPAQRDRAIARVAGQREALAGATAAAGAAMSVEGLSTEHEHAHARRGATLRVDVGGLDAVLDLSGELQLALNRLRGCVDGPTEGPGPLRDAVHEVERLHEMLQDRIVALRMVPIGPLLRSFVRMVRDVAEVRDRPIRLVTEGLDVTVDGNVVERLREPLAHLVRNALDHGLEAPDVRLGRGKSATGLITLRARRNGAMLEVDVEDDGGGFDGERIRERAHALGIVGHDVADPAAPTDDESVALAFTHGLSTATTLTTTSGRGVGMDAVRRTLESIRGSVVVASRRGEATCVTLRVPVHLLLIEGIEVEVGEAVYVVPSAAVVACLALPAPAWSSHVGVVPFAGGALAWARLDDLLTLPEETSRPRELVVVSSAEHRLGLAVDRVRGIRRVLMKPLGGLLRGARCLSGCTLLETGQLALVLDVDRLVRATGPMVLPGPNEAAAAP
jgi:two-component system chemotaxis sensor kinase CheA